MKEMEFTANAENPSYICFRKPCDGLIITKITVKYLKE